MTSDVAVLTVAPSPLIYQSIHHADGSFALSFVSQPGSVNVVLHSTNLSPPIVWSRLSTNSAAVTGDWRYTDTNAVRYRAGFYRSLMSTSP